jgi:hypothetical protein
MIYHKNKNGTYTIMEVKEAVFNDLLPILLYHQLKEQQPKINNYSIIKKQPQ